MVLAVVFVGDMGREETPLPTLSRGLCRLDGREAELGIGNWLGEARAANGFFVAGCTGIGMRLGVEGATGAWRGEAKLAGSRGGTRGEPAWEVRREGRTAAARVGVPVNLEDGTLIRRPELTAVEE